MHKPFLACFKNRPFLQTQSLSFAQTFPYPHPKQPFSTLRLPFQPPLTYCLQRIQLFFCCSLNSLRRKAGASHRFKSLPAIPDEVAAFRKTGYLMNVGRFRNNHVSTCDLNRPRSPEVRKPLVYFWYFSYTRKVRKTFLSQGAPRFCKPRPSPPQPQLRTATIKTFLWKLRGFANLKAAHTNNKFAQTKLNPFSNLRRTKTCRRQLLCVRAYFLLAQKVLQKSPPCREFAAFGSFFTGERSPGIPSACSLCACGKPWKNTVHSQILPKRPLL